MNKLIKELLDEACEYAHSKHFAHVKKFKYVTPDQHANAQDTMQEKFTELIVLEMCNVLDKAQWDKGEDWVCADGTRIIPQIKNHFGVKE